MLNTPENPPNSPEYELYQSSTGCLVKNNNNKNTKNFKISI